MRFTLTLLLLATLPMAAMAQQYDSPMVVVSQGAAQQPAQTAAATTAATQQTASAQPKVYTPDFPEWAVTQVGANSSGVNKDIPPSPASPEAPSAGDAPTTPQNPSNPVSPPSPASKLWPIDTVPIFLQSCTGYHVELVPACTCIAQKLMTTIPHDEFLDLSLHNQIEQDPRLQAIREQCLSAKATKE